MNKMNHKLLYVIYLLSLIFPKYISKTQKPLQWCQSHHCSYRTCRMEGEENGNFLEVTIPLFVVKVMIYGRQEYKFI